MSVWRRTLRLALPAHFFLFALFASAQGIITTVAGTSWTFRGAGGPATSATLGETLGVAVDASGNVFVSDGGNSLLLKITPSGTLTIVAGNGIRGYSGDGGLATSAALNLPVGGQIQAGVALDAAGNLYVTETGSHRVRKVSPDGKISTVAGGVGAGFSGDGGPGTSAALNNPTGLAADTAGNLYIADSRNHRIRRVSPNGTITTVAGNGVAAFSGDGGPATAASFNIPSAIAVDSGGNLYMGEEGNRRIRKVTPQGTISTVAGGVPEARGAPLLWPTSGRRGASRWIGPATSTLRTPQATASAKWAQTGGSRP